MAKPSLPTPLEPGQAEFFRDKLRGARAATLADREGFHELLHSFETIGQIRRGAVGTLRSYEPFLRDLAEKSPLSNDIPSQWPQYHTRFDALYKEMREARNDAMHQGSRARILTDHSIELTLVLEDATMNHDGRISQFMVRDVVAAELWHPVSYARQQMLKYAFSYLPLYANGRWKFVADYALTHYLRAADGKRRERLATTLNGAIDAEDLFLVPADVRSPDATLASVLSSITQVPILVAEPTRADTLLGILTAADVL